MLNLDLPLESNLNIFCVKKATPAHYQKLCHEQKIFVFYLEDSLDLFMGQILFQLSAALSQ